MPWKDFQHDIRRFSASDQARIEKAFVFAEEAHQGQKRKSGEPYFTHPVEVARMLIAIDADADTVIAALLHDTVEDTEVTLKDIKKLFNGSVSAIVDGITKLTAEELEEHPTLDEQIETLRKIFTLMEKDVRIMVIKIIDRLHNMRTVSFLEEKKQKALAKETLEVYVKIADRLCMQDIHNELEELCQKILDPANAAAIVALRTKNEENIHTTLKQMQNVLDAHTSTALPYSMLYERKSWNALAAQLQLGQYTATGISTYTIVFVTENIDDCYRILGLLHQSWKRETLSFQDFINAPRLNGYQGVHTTIILEDGTRVRCKIRTKEMHAYARKGVATKCFDSTAEGILTYLPWAERISPLSKDTQDRSQEFWESLQSDILDESIVVHGPGDETVMVPKDSTVLDAAFYLFGNESLRAKKITMNGADVPFGTKVKNAATIAIEISRSHTIERSWLHMVNTGFSLAKIRSELKKKSEDQKITIGKHLLQEILLEKKKGYIEEFDEESISDALHTIGFSTLEEAYIAIADGTIDAVTLYLALFAQKIDVQMKKTHVSHFQFFFPLSNIEIVTQLLGVYQKYRKSYKNMKIFYNPISGMGIAKTEMELDSQAQTSYMQDLESAGATGVKRASRKNAGLSFSLIVAILLILWGLDPVIGRMILSSNAIPAIDMTLIRFWSLTGISSLLLLWQSKKESMPQVWLPLRNISLWSSVLLLICVALATYTSLQTTLPSHYTIPMTAAGIVLTSIVNKKYWKTLILTWALLCSGVLILILQTPEWTSMGVFSTIIAVIAFSFFSIVSERYKREEHIQARSAQYFFLLSILCSTLTLPLLLRSTLTVHSAQTLTQMVLYSIIFAGLPYYIYYFLLSHKQIDFVLRYSFLIIFTTLAGQFFITGNVSWGNVLPSSALVILGAILPIMQKEYLKYK